MRYILLFIVLFVLCTVPVTANGVSGVPYPFYSFVKCVGIYQAQVTTFSNVDYMLPGCTLTNATTKVWSCPCSANASILVKQGQAGIFDVRIQHYIDNLKPLVTPRVNNIPTQEEIFNDNIRRIDYIKGVIITAYVGDDTPTNDQIANISSLVFFIVVVVLIFIIVVGGIVVFIFVFGNRVRRWLGLVEEEELTIKKILVAIFSRSSIKRKSIGKRDKSFENSQVESVTQVKQSNTEDEVRRILKEIGQ